MMDSVSCSGDQFPGGDGYCPYWVVVAICVSVTTNVIKNQFYSKKRGRTKSRCLQKSGVKGGKRWTFEGDRVGIEVKMNGINVNV